MAMPSLLLPNIISFKPHSRGNEVVQVSNTESNIADFLAARGYGVALVSSVDQILYGIRSSKYDESSLGEPGLSGRIRSTLLVLDGGVFRALPISLKKPFYDEGNWFFAPAAAIHC